MSFTAKQLAYIEHRAAGHRGTVAAKMAGFLGNREAAGRLEKNPEIQSAIEAARAKPLVDATPQTFNTAEELLEAVVQGVLDVDIQTRIGAAKTLIAYQSRKRRQPLKPAKTPGQQERSDIQARANDGRDLLAEIKRKHGVR